MQMKDLTGESEVHLLRTESIETCWFQGEQNINQNSNVIDGLKRMKQELVLLMEIFCRKCGKLNNFEIACRNMPRNKNKNTHSDFDVISEDESDSENILCIDAFITNQTKNDDLKIELEINENLVQLVVTRILYVIFFRSYVVDPIVQGAGDTHVSELDKCKDICYWSLLFLNVVTRFLDNIGPFSPRTIAVIWLGNDFVNRFTGCNVTVLLLLIKIDVLWFQY